MPDRQQDAERHRLEVDAEHVQQVDAVSEKNCAYLKKPSEPRLIAIDDARIARRYDGRCTRSIQCEASQSKPVVAMINSTKNGFHAA